MSSTDLAAIVLAAGKGKRMDSDKAKVLLHLGGRPMLDHVLDTLESAGVGKIIVVVGHQGEEVRAHVRAHVGGRVQCVTQAEQLGTGHAVMQARGALEDFPGLVLVTCGDTPLWKPETFREAIEHAGSGSPPGTGEEDVSHSSGLVLTMLMDDPAGYGRVILAGGDDVARIVEQRDATDEEKKVREVNSGTFCFRSRPLFEALDMISNENAQGEYYLTDVVEIMIQSGGRVGRYLVSDPTEAMGINSIAELAAAQEIFQRRRGRSQGGATRGES